ILYIAYTLFSLFYYIGITGFDFQYFIPNYPTVAHHSKLVFVILSSFSFYNLIIVYFKEEKQGIWLAKKLHVPVMALLGLLFLVVTFQDFYLSFFADDWLQYNFVPVLLLGFISLLVFYTLIRIVYFNPIWQNILFLVGFSFLIVQVIFAVFINNGLIQIPFSYTTLNILATTCELICLSILFFEKLLALRREKQLLATEVEMARVEQEKAAKIKELDEAKTRLYTNITHEFRTPLTVIKGLTEQIVDNEDKKQLIQRNSDTLLRLINQLLNLSKTDKGEMPFQPIQNDIVQYLRYLSESFRSWGATKNIRLHFLPNVAHCQTDYDPDKLQDVLSNLLSNAIKNTAKGGDIYIFIKKEAQQLVISVKDTGVGIAAHHLPNIFDRFYQIDQTDVRRDVGTGIGLALCKELVQIMNGEICVRSELGVGSEFEITLPISQKAQKINQSTPEISLKSADDFVDNQNLVRDDISKQSQRNSDTANQKATILVVEDNQDVRHYLTLCLEQDFELIFAQNGKVGIEKALSTIPDLVLSDIMMPDTNGLELCENLKTNVVTSHIPLILLTAKADQRAKLQGLSRGADAYLTKPFNKEELLTRIHSLIAQRSRMQAHFLKNATSTKTKKYAVENQFLNNLKEIVEAHLNDETFDVQRLAFELKMSRSQVYRKVKALTGRSIASYIRYLRLQKGKQQLETTNLTVSEIAYNVGFKDLAYFSNSFSQEFGYAPNATRK
ncbi:MAG: ATP-binding protein, partial [Bacteroidota bacterium]